MAILAGGRAGGRTRCSPRRRRCTVTAARPREQEEETGLSPAAPRDFTGESEGGRDTPAPARRPRPQPRWGLPRPRGGAFRRRPRPSPGAARAGAPMPGRWERGVSFAVHPLEPTELKGWLLPGQPCKSSGTSVRKCFFECCRVWTTEVWEEAPHGGAKPAA